ncbi:hypothetical protein JCM10213v2_004128 [Rhodosporidiobolus nylandii]
MPPRFWSSPYKNAVATPAKREGWYSELSLATALPNETSDGLVATAEYSLSLGGSSGSLVAIPYSLPPGKFASRAPSLSTGLRTITSFSSDSFSEYLYVGGESGIVKVFDLPAAESFGDNAALSPTPLLSLETSTGKPVEILSAHPLASALFLAVSGSTLSVFDAASGRSEAARKVDMPGQAWSAQWSADGRLVTATGRDGKLRVWDIRQGDGVVAETTAHTGVKASRHVHLPPSTSSTQILTTGFSRTRDREYSLFDLRSTGPSSRPAKTQRLDTNTGVLQPLLDESRGIVYLAGRGDMTLRWVEVGGPAVFTEGAAPLPAPLLSAALLPPPAQQAHLDLQHAEINRLLVLSPAEGAVVPVEVKVPRRQYVDFHQDLYPPAASGVPALSSAEWLAAKDSDDTPVLPKRQLEPGKAWPKREKKAATTTHAALAKQAEAKEPAAPPPVPVVEPTTTPAASSPLPSQPAVTAPSPATSAPPSHSEQKLEKEAAPTASLSSLSLDDEPKSPTAGEGTTKAAPPTAASPAPSTSRPAPSSTSTPAAATSTASSTPLAAPSPAAVKPGGPFNPGWSRKFLTGKTPLKPDYFDVKDLSATTSAEVVLLKTTPTYLLYPLSGPGGRLAVHPLAQKGRLSTHVPALQTGAVVVDFEVDPFGGEKVFVAGDDGAIRVFELPDVAEGWEKKVEEAQGKVLSDSRMDRISTLAHHPAAKDLLLSVSDDHGKPTVRLWNVETGTIVAEAALPKGGVSSVAWSPDGILLAVATKNKQLHVLDPRKPSSLISTASHDSIRPVRLAWAPESHLISTGFNRSASRELILYSLAGGKLAQAGKQTLDISPAPLFPFYDLDTRVLLLYSRGERSCLAFEVDLAEASKTPFSKLPSFEHGTLQSAFAFGPKTKVDVKAVEVLHALRLTPSEIQSVSFTIPRAKAEYFQNDIYVPTRNTEKPTMSVEDYVAGKDKPLELVDLRPQGMQLLSEAPVQQKTVSTRSQIKQDGLTDSQREKAYLDK